ncbi:unnamed protein product [Sphenostylis stenocarpa]|uniref:WRKY domain-containing protein n=1 Tax=Sphenostylis stenocarpa TaxID=92480 RepID=A0AA86SDJ0_9FABA|nr:unnamed protein product [Sphenostylis stenocarpa]
MEKHQVLSTIYSSSSSSSSASASDFNSDVHGVKKGGGGGVLRTENGSEKGGKEIKRRRYAFETRSEVDILDDGYRWRKYGEKSVKNNKFPRSYYRCSYRGCNVKKQIQRHAKDEEIVVTTYEGLHSHPVENSTTESFEQILLRNHHIYTLTL